MKNLTKRNKIVLAIVGVLVIVVIAVAAFAQVGGSELFGTVTYPYFSPASASINAGKTVTLKVVGNPALQAPQCTFTTSSGAASLNKTAMDTVVATGVSAGTATITAACNVGTITAQVTVSGPTPTPTRTPTATPTPTPTLAPMAIRPANPTVKISNTIVLWVINKRGTCIDFFATDSNVVTVDVLDDGVGKVIGRAVGTTYVSFVCDYRFVTTIVTVTQ